MSQPAAAVRSLRAAVVDALRSGVGSVSGRVYTPPVAESEPLPYVVVSNYTEGQRNFHGRPGSVCGMDVKCYAHSVAGDGPVMKLWEECYAALHRVPLAVDGHLHLYGTLRLVVTLTDPDDANLLQAVGRYDAETKVI